MTEQEIEKLNSGRIMREASMVLLPQLKTMRDGVIGRITQAHREPGPGVDNLLRALAAELTVLTDLINKLDRNNKETDARERKIT